MPWADPAAEQGWHALAGASPRGSVPLPGGHHAASRRRLPPGAGDRAAAAGRLQTRCGHCLRLLGAWVADAACAGLVGAVDRQNATGTQDDLKASPDTCLPHREFAHDTCLSICCWRHSNHEWVCRALSRAQHEKAAFLLALRPKKVRESQYHTHAENACGKCPCISYRHLPQAQTLVSITVGDLMHAGSPGRIAHWLCCTEHCRH